MKVLSVEEVDHLELDQDSGRRSDVEEVPGSRRLSAGSSEEQNRELEVENQRLRNELEQAKKRLAETRHAHSHLEGQVEAVANANAHAAELMAQLEESQHELQKARDAALAASQTKSMFLANMSHELRTPLTAIIGLSDLLLDSGLGAREYKFVETVQSSANLLLDIITDILDFSKIEAGELVLEHGPFDLYAVLSDSLELVRAQAESKGITLSPKLDAQIPSRVYGDQLRMRQVVLNLLSNAIKFTQKGGVVKVDATAEHINERSVDFRMVVRDNGIGIAPDRLGDIFEAFKQADASTTRTYGGTGLGLAIVRRIVETAGGTIEASSEFGCGTTFEVRLSFKSGMSLESDSGQEPGQTPDPNADQLPALRILLAEDHEINQFVVSAMLEDLGQQVDVVPNGEEATKAVASSDYDLVLMDMHMPITDGIAATERIRQSQGNQVYIVALTANAQKEDRARCIQVGMNDYLVKPVQSDDLRDCLRRYVVHKSA